MFSLFKASNFMFSITLVISISSSKTSSVTIWVEMGWVRKARDYMTSYLREYLTEKLIRKTSVNEG